MRCNDTYNGCTNCGPSLTIYAKSAGRSLVKFGYEPLVALPNPVPIDMPIRYLSFSANGDFKRTRDSYRFSCGGCTDQPGGCNCGYCRENYPEVNCAGDAAGAFNVNESNDFQTSIIFDYKLNTEAKCGEQILITDSNDKTNYKVNYIQTVSPFGPVGQLESTYPISSSYTHNFIRSAFNTYGNLIISSNSYGPYDHRSSSTSSTLETSYEGVYHSYFMPCSQYSILPDFRLCALNNQSTSSSSEYSTGNSFRSQKYIWRLNTPKTRVFFQPITEQVLDISLKTKDSNGNFCSLYSPFNGLSVADKNELTYTAVQVAKFGIGVDKKILIDKKISSIHGTLYLFYGGEEGETPCCQDCGGPECFTGTIVSQSDFSITNSPQDKEFPIDIVGQKELFEFRNLKSDITPGTSLSCCYTIKSIT